MTEARRSVLIVDDSPDGRDVLQRGRSGLVEVDSLKPVPRAAGQPQTTTAV